MQSALCLRPSYHLRFYQHRLLQKIIGLRTTRKKKLSFMSFPVSSLLIGCYTSVLPSHKASGSWFHTLMVGVEFLNIVTLSHGQEAWPNKTYVQLLNPSVPFWEKLKNKSIYIHLQKDFFHHSVANDFLPQISPSSFTRSFDNSSYFPAALSSSDWAQKSSVKPSDFEMAEWQHYGLCFCCLVPTFFLFCRAIKIKIVRDLFC